MPTPVKLLEQLKANPVDMSYSDVRKLLTARGWRIRESGSHVIVTSPRGANVTLARTPNRVNRTYLKRILQEIDRSDGE
jgi:predicted RNA binding protein YcfA (HicA-like mRNA interferase family)